MFTIHLKNSKGQTAESIFLPIFGSTLVSQNNRIENALGSLLLRREYAIQENNDSQIEYYENMLESVKFTISLIRQKLGKDYGTVEFKPSEFAVCELRKGIFFTVNDLPKDAYLFVSIRKRTEFEKKRTSLRAQEQGLKEIDFGGEVITWFIGIERADNMLKVDHDTAADWFGTSSEAKEDTK